MSVNTLHRPAERLRAPAGLMPVSASTRARRDFDLGLWQRVGVVVALTALAYFSVFEQVFIHAIDGSRAAFLIAVPVLVGIAATGYREAPQGIGDGESDWILALLAGVVGFTGVHLLGERMPTLAALWGLPLVTVLLWLACSVAVLFSARHVVQMWAVWLFALCCATPLPYLLVLAALGGSDTAATLLVAGMGAVAVFLAAHRAPLASRLLPALASLAGATAYAFTVGQHMDQLVDIIVAGVLLPIAAVSVHRLTAARAEADRRPALKRCSPVSLAVVAAVAALLFVSNPPATSRADIRQVPADWAATAGLGIPLQYDFITRYLGDGASLHRYHVPATPAMPAAAVDVMSAPNHAVLEDYSNAVWYPAARPLEYQAAESLAPFTVGARAIHTDADAAITSSDSQWYAVTWVWRAADTFQRITVVVNQNPDSVEPPPPPAPLTLLHSVAQPVLWIARQQPDADSNVNPLVVQRATDLADQLLTIPADEGAEVPVGA
ncbi:hypothetical protein JRC04_28405 [Mycolicibacterium sp. S2-37]|uniref:hypothetical protein n=1 Tax=Mycolicibacterium sp. S2-37 TaxID=2810297 RepID=UPI001A954277|nr:hypothetical protein [Mycolicibacterium sp. S2-37]MBO0681403.1 hypothetical protein [Mycolicibacterium sp. S2-37]